jgi:hypothetical protein
MKKFFSTTLMIFMLVSQVISAASLSVHSDSTNQKPPSQTRVLSETPGAVENGYQLLFEIPTPKQILAETSHFEYETYYDMKYIRVQNELRMFQSEGSVLKVERDEENFSAIVWLQEAEDNSFLANISGIASVFRLGENTACGEDRKEIVESQLRTAEQFLRANQEPTTTITRADAPTIRVYMDIYYTYNTTGGSISGQTTPNTLVTIQVENVNGDLIIQREATSNDEGYYWLWPSYKSCVGYEWSLSTGQTVIVTANGKTAVFQIPTQDAQAYPASNLVLGTTAPYRQVDIIMYRQSGCEWMSILASTTSGVDGTISLDLTAQGGFTHIDWFDMRTYDNQLNFVESGFNIPQIIVSKYGIISGYVTQPYASVMIQVERSGGVIQELLTKASGDGYFSLYSSQFIPGDRVIVTAEGAVMTFDTPVLSNLLINPDTGQITGETTPGYLVKVDGWSLCSSFCDAENANVSGEFVLNVEPSALFIPRSTGIEIYDLQGHYFYSGISIPSIAHNFRGYSAELIIRGFIYGDVSVEIYDGAALVDNFVLPGPDNYHYQYLDNPYPAGYRIVVSDSQYTKELIVSDISSYIDSNANTIIGSTSPGGSLALTLNTSWAFPSDYHVEEICDATHNPDGSFQADSAYDIKASAYAHIYHIDDDGDYSTDYGFDLYLDVEKNYDYIGGHRRFPSEEVQLTIVSNIGSVVDICNISPHSVTPEYGYSFGCSVTPLEPGYVIYADNGGYTTSFIMPDLTVNESPQENLLFGQSPANQPVYPYLNLSGRNLNFVHATQSNASGDYSVAFDEIYEYDYRCETGTVGGCYQSSAAYFDDQGHQITVSNSFPPHVEADAFDQGDGDNEHTKASVYLGLQSHTFHSYNDEDWIATYISASGVGKLYSFRTLNLGVAATTYLTLFDSDGVTELVSHAPYHAPAFALWRPTHEGWYYVQVSSGGYYWDCGSTYDFEIRMEADWTVLIYMNGDNDLGYFAGQARRELEQVVGSLNNTNVLMLWDGMDTITGDTWRYEIQPNGQYQDNVNRWYMGELNLGDKDTLKNFIEWGVSTYPANHYYLVIADHGQGVRGLSWDFNAYQGENHIGNKNFSNSDMLTPMELNEVFQEAAYHGINFDILHYDTCLMGMLEHAWQVKDFADYLIFSQNEGYSVFNFAEYVSLLEGNDTARIASQISDAYANSINLIGYPYTISVIDLSQIDNLNQNVSDLAVQLNLLMATEKDQIKLARDSAQHLDSTSDWVLNTTDSMIDLYDFSLKLQTHVNTAEVNNLAANIQNNISQCVISEHHASGTYNTNDINLDNVHGISIYFPPQNGHLFTVYAANQMFTETQDFVWDEMLVSYYGALGLPPNMDDPDLGEPSIGRVEHNNFIPIILR